MNDFFKAIRSYLIEYLPKQKCFSKNTIKSYRDALNLLTEYLRSEKQLEVRQIRFNLFDRTLILGYLDWLEKTRLCSATSRNQRLMVLRSFFRYAGQMDCTQLALQVEVDDIPTKKVPGKVVEFLSEDAMQALLRQPDTATLKGVRNQFFMILMYDTAARCGELLTLRVKDLRINTRHPVVYLTGKGNKTRSVPLMPKTVEHCKQYLRIFHRDDAMSGEAPVFYTKIHGAWQMMSADNVAAFMKKYGEAARLNCSEIPARVHPHQLRHTRAIHFYRSGMPLSLLSEYLGHANAETTKIYAYADTEMKRLPLKRPIICERGF